MAAAPVMESVDTESKDSYIGSFFQPPDKISSAFADLGSKKATAVTKDTSVPNNQALVKALKTLQEKIHRLELERSQAEDDLNCLSREAAQYKKALQHESDKDITHQELMQERKDVSMQLGAAQSCCSLLEKQLDYMRKMMVSAELEKKLVLEQQEKIKHLEQKFQEEQHQRKLIQDKAAQLQTGLEMNRILMSSLSPQKDVKKKSRKKKTVKKHSDLRKACVSQPYLPTGTLPFVAGKSASSSHSVVANVQSVLHMMKYRSPCAPSQLPEGTERRTSKCTGMSRPASCSASSATENLSDLILIMQDELGQMSFRF